MVQDYAAKDSRVKIVGWAAGVSSAYKLAAYPRHTILDILKCSVGLVFVPLLINKYQAQDLEKKDEYCVAVAI